MVNTMELTQFETSQKKQERKTGRYQVLIGGQEENRRNTKDTFGKVPKETACRRDFPKN
jgi:tRNA nucleotidyltransferase/poly(A) polymerase